MIAIADGVHRLQHSTVRRKEQSWRYAEEKAEAIAAYWHKRQAANPKFFNGRVFMMTEAGVEGGVLHGSVTETDFAASLYWREHGFEDADVVDLFAAAIIRCADGALIYGRQSPGHVNGGFAYPPSGFLDLKDVRSDGAADLAASAAREALEETGISDFSAEPGFLLVRQGPYLCAGFVLHSPLSSGEFLEKAGALIKAQDDAELEALMALKHKADIAAYPMRDYAKMIAEALLD